MGSDAVSANCTMSNIETTDCVIERDCTTDDNGGSSNCHRYDGLKYWYHVTSDHCDGKELSQVMTQMSEGIRCDELPASPPIYSLNATFDECWVNCDVSEFSFFSPSAIEAEAAKLVMTGAILIGVGCGLCWLILLLQWCVNCKD